MGDVYVGPADMSKEKAPILEDERPRLTQIEGSSEAVSPSPVRFESLVAQRLGQRTNEDAPERAAST